MSNQRRFNFLRGLRSSNFFIVFNRTEDKARGRVYLISSAILANIAAVLFTGTFYTGFLLANNIDIVKIGIIGFVPYIVSLFSLLSPTILSKMPRRKPFLLTMRCLYYFFIVVAITLLPYMGLTQDLMLILLTVFIFIGHSCNAVSTIGYFVWHKKLLPDNVRPSYFSYSLAFTGVINSVALLLSSFLADFLKDSGQELLGMVVIRAIAVIFAAADVLCLSRIQEYPYENAEKKTRLSDIFTLPFKKKKYLLTMVLLMWWNTMAFLTAAFVSVYLIDTVQISYTYINAMTALYALFLIFLTPVWKKFYQKHEMFKTMVFAVLIAVPLYLLYAFLTADNYIWLYPLLVLGFHTCNVGLNMAFANVPYVNMPHENEECYTSFYVVVANITAFFGQMLGTLFVGVIGDGALVIGGFSFTSVQMLLAIQGVLMLLFAWFVHRITPRIQPEL